MTAGAHIGRRAFLALSAGVLLGSGCDSTSPTGPGGSSAQTGRRTTNAPPSTTSPAATTQPTSSPTLPAAQAWQPSPGDLSPDLKRRAAVTVVALGTWGVGSEGATGAAERLRAIGADTRLLEQSRALWAPARAAALEVVTAQYGGLLSDSASVLVVCRQWRVTTSGDLESGGTTVDVRLAPGRPHWVVTAMHPGALAPPAAPPSNLARQVAGSPRIELPPAARADVLSGRVHDSVLSGLLRLSAAYRIGVSVIRSGHPVNVFGTSRVSDHSDGRAFDTFRIDGRLVVDPATPRSLVTDYMTAAVDAGAYNVGGPAIPTGSAGAYFSDDTHHDHVHVAFSA